MKNVTEAIKGMISGMVSSMISGDSREWPPTCAVLIYQPMRPYTKKATDDTHQDNDYDALNQ